ncbi:transcriptional regulation of mitochondrial recombination-domain-containing protein [Coniella lustricola]|uniref:Large ribosomal subunit protein mL67 n=1 Tax=Coniella lustricola TaxID=2025994 RepID=A0A2T3AN20_9PEZI|nr:transcriptional regulation of mitochondrial recombination-domain-containing protein [Coniella lustricola]
MNSTPASLVGILDSLAIGVFRTSIRQAHTQTRFRRKKYNLTGFTPGHGENIYIFNHIENGMVIYSHEPILKRDSQKYLSQIPFTVKKQKPPVIRADYWQPLCMIEFGPGQGVVGRNVFQKLREFRTLHELEWGWQADEFKKLNRYERGKRIHDQKPNTVADIAAVLAGAGRGNLMWMSEKQARVLEAAEAAAAKAAAKVAAKEAEEKAAAARAAEAANAVESGKAAPSTTQEQTTQEQATPASVAPETQTTTVAAVKAKSEKPARRLHKATIYWSNDADLYWARDWSDNVEHEVGLPDGIKVWRWQTREIMGHEDEEGPEVMAEENPAENGEQGQEGGDAGKFAEGEAKEAEVVVEPKSDSKKSWLGWLGGRKGGSGSQDVRP